MILVLCELSTGEEREYFLDSKEGYKSELMYKNYANTHRVWESYVVSMRDGIYEIREDYYFLILSLSEIEHMKKVHRGESIVHHMEYKLRNKNLMGLKGRVTTLGRRIIKLVNQFDKSRKQY